MIWPWQRDSIKYPHCQIISLLISIEHKIQNTSYLMGCHGVHQVLSMLGMKCCMWLWHECWSHPRLLACVTPTPLRSPLTALQGICWTEVEVWGEGGHCNSRDLNLSSLNPALGTDIQKLVREKQAERIKPSQHSQLALPRGCLGASHTLKTSSSLRNFMQ